MRKAPAYFVVLVLLIPNLVCAMTACPASATLSELYPSAHCDGAEKVSPAEQSDALMFLADCAGVEWAGAATPNPLESRKFALGPAEFDHVATTSLFVNISSESGGGFRVKVRHNPAFVGHPIYLYTRRLRI